VYITCISVQLHSYRRTVISLKMITLWCSRFHPFCILSPHAQLQNFVMSFCGTSFSAGSLLFFKKWSRLVMALNLLDRCTKHQWWGKQCPIQTLKVNCHQCAQSTQCPTEMICKQDSAFLMLLTQQLITHNAIMQRPNFKLAFAFQFATISCSECLLFCPYLLTKALIFSVVIHV
jgi:hypothetical protein